MADFNVRADAVDVEQIMAQIRGRIREKRGVDYTEEQIQELAKVKLEKVLDPKGLRSDLLELLEAASVTGGLRGIEPEWSGEWAVTLVLASRGYPASSSKGDEITGLRSVDSLEVEVLHAGTAEDNGRIVTAGGRVLNVTGLGSTPAEARERAYDAAQRIEFDGKQMRGDIAARAVERVGV